VAFLSTRVKAPDVDDYKKLARVIKYLRGTANMPLTLEAQEAHVMKWWVDAAYAVHEDMKGHTGGAFTMGQGTIYGTSTKQKLVTRSSTEAGELVGICHRSYGPDTSYKLKAMTLVMPSCTKITKVQYYWKKMVEDLVARGHDTLTFAISLSLTEFGPKKSVCSTVPQMTWCPTISLSRFKAPSFVNSEIK
jgi:hypothetical protein